MASNCKDCKVRLIKTNDNMIDGDIQFCPLHKVAGDLLKALRDLYRFVVFLVGSPESERDDPELKAARKVILEAIKKP